MANVSGERRDWSREEVEATIADYRAMLLMELRGQAVNKREHNRSLQRLLASRSAGAIERKHQNISAILLYENDFPYIDGYKPLHNVQGLLREVVEERIVADPQMLALVVARSLDPPPIPTVDDILRALTAPPDPKPRRDRVASPPRPRWRGKTDYIFMEARNAALGHAGEEFVVNYERARLIHEGYDRLAECIEQVSVTMGDDEGFDVLSYTAPNRQRLIEVKTTSYPDHTPFYVSRNELEASRFKRDFYHVYRVYTFHTDPRLFILPGAIDANCRLDPHQFTASPGTPAGVRPWD
jgi:hypothetical protein